jgi:hypothetical protein
VRGGEVEAVSRRRTFRVAGLRASSASLYIVVLWLAAAASISGCERRIDGEREAAAGLVDSVAALPGVGQSAAGHVAGARAALAHGDSLLAAQDWDAAREAYAAAMVFARIAVVEAEKAARLDSAGAAAPISASPESRSGVLLRGK